MDTDEGRELEKMFGVAGNVWRMFDPRDKRLFPGVLAMVLFYSITETLSIGILLPFLDLLTHHEKLQTNRILSFAYAFSGSRTITEFIVFCGIGLFAVYVLKLLYSVLFSYIQLAYSRRVFNHFTKRLFSNLVGQSYMDITHSNTADYNQVLLVETNNTVGLIQEILTLLAEAITITFLFLLMLTADYMLTLSTCGIIMLTYFAVSSATSKRLFRLGEKKTALLGKVFRSLDETFGNIKIIKINCKEDHAVDRFTAVSVPYNATQIPLGVIQGLPRSVFEFVGFTVLIFLMVAGIRGGGVLNVGKITLFALSFYRIMPSVNRIAGVSSKMKFHRRSVELIEKYYYMTPEQVGDSPCPFVNKIRLHNVGFSFSKDKPLLRGVNVEIAKGAKVGFMGQSGAGKSTLVDIISGLYMPDSGTVFIDETPLSASTTKAWRSKIGYIPQDIYLFDGTVVDNVCMGYDYDEDLLKDVLIQAKADKFLSAKEGVNTRVGEGGVMLSGGQMQRIAIARALYKRPEILVLDEATSALDADTETGIIDEIFEMAESRNITLIIVTHRPSTIKNCDAVFRVENGEVRPCKA